MGVVTDGGVVTGVSAGGGGGAGVCSSLVDVTAGVVCVVGDCVSVCCAKDVAEIKITAKTAALRVIGMMKVAPPGPSDVIPRDSSYGKVKYLKSLRENIR